MTNRNTLRLNNTFRAICRALTSLGCTETQGMKIEELAAATGIDSDLVFKAVKHFTKLGYLAHNTEVNEYTRTSLTEKVA